MKCDKGAVLSHSSFSKRQFLTTTPWSRLTTGHKGTGVFAGVDVSTTRSRPPPPGVPDRYRTSILGHLRIHGRSVGAAVTFLVRRFSPRDAQLAGRSLARACRVMSIDSGMVYGGEIAARPLLGILGDITDIASQSHSLGYGLRRLRGDTRRPGPRWQSRLKPGARRARFYSHALARAKATPHAQTGQSMAWSTTNISKGARRRGGLGRHDNRA